MHLLLKSHRHEVEQACRRFHVRKLAAFGSVLRDDFGPESDVDMLVSFEPSAEMDAFVQYFGFKEALEAILGRTLDLVVADVIRNPSFRAAVEQTQAPLYEAA